MSDYAEQMKKAVKYISDSIEMAMLWGTQPRKRIVIFGHGQQCPLCDGRGHDDGGPGSWTCRFCDGIGRLKLLRVYRCFRYLPFKATDPRAGTARERKGLTT